jgi:hypothetical protein
MFYFTLRAVRSRKSLRTDSLVDESNALVVKLVFLFNGNKHGLEVAFNKELLLWFGFREVIEEGDESGKHVKECMFMYNLSRK